MPRGVRSAEVCGRRHMRPAARGTARRGARAGEVLGRQKALRARSAEAVQGARPARRAAGGSRAGRVAGEARGQRRELHVGRWWSGTTEERHCCTMTRGVRRRRCPVGMAGTVVLSPTSRACNRDECSGRKPSDGGVLGRRFPCWGRLFGASFLLHEVSGRKPCLVSRRATAAPLASYAPCRRCLLRPAQFAAWPAHCLWRPRPVLATPSWDKLKGVTTTRQGGYLLVIKGRRLGVARLLAADHGGRRCFAIVGSVWDSVWRTALVATASGDDSACSGSRRVGQHG